MGDERGLNDWELSILARLVGAASSNREVLRRQIKSAVVEQQDPDRRIPTIGLQVQDRDVPELSQNRGAIVSAYAKDDDGGQVEVVLLGLDGRIDELQVLRSDGRRLMSRPDAIDLFGFY